MENKILVTRSSMPKLDEYMNEITPMWDSHWLTNMGPKHKELQADLCEYLGVENIDLLTNGHMAYIRFYSCKKRNWELYTAIFIALGILSIICCLIIGNRINEPIAYKFVSDSNTFIAFAISVCSFMFFKQCNIRYSKLINTIGGSTFGVLCIHANSSSMRKWLWKTIFDVEDHYILPTTSLIVYSFSCVALVFVCCTLLDIIRKKYIESVVVTALTNSKIFKCLQDKFGIINEHSLDSK